MVLDYAFSLLVERFGDGRDEVGGLLIDVVFVKSGEKRSKRSLVTLVMGFLDNGDLVLTCLLVKGEDS